MLTLLEQNNIRERAGAGVRIRVGGNSQEDSTIHEGDSTFDAQNKLIVKSPNLNSKIPVRLLRVYPALEAPQKRSSRGSARNRHERHF